MAGLRTTPSLVMGRAGAVSFDYEASQPGPGSPSVRVIRPSARKAHDLLPVEYSPRDQARSGSAKIFFIGPLYS